MCIFGKPRDGLIIHMTLNLSIWSQRTWVVSEFAIMNASGPAPASRWRKCIPTKRLKISLIPICAFSIWRTCFFGNKYRGSLGKSSILKNGYNKSVVETNILPPNCAQAEPVKLTLPDFKAKELLEVMKVLFCFLMPNFPNNASFDLEDIDSRRMPRRWHSNSKIPYNHPQSLIIKTSEKPNQENHLHQSKIKTCTKLPNTKISSFQLGRKFLDTGNKTHKSNHLKTWFDHFTELIKYHKSCNEKRGQKKKKSSRTTSSDIEIRWRKA